MQLVQVNFTEPTILGQLVRFLTARPSCGFPSPAADHEEAGLDLQQLLVKRPAATFILRVSGTSMRRAGIHPGDLVICDRSEKARPGNIVVAVLDGDLVVKRLDRTDTGRAVLLSDPDPEDKEEHLPLLISDGAQFEVWGRVMSVVHFP